MAEEDRLDIRAISAAIAFAGLLAGGIAAWMDLKVMVAETSVRVMENRERLKELPPEGLVQQVQSLTEKVTKLRVDCVTLDELSRMK